MAASRNLNLREGKKRRAAVVMMVEVMKVAQQPAMAYDKDSLSRVAQGGESGLLLNSLYVSTKRTTA
jgi:hypothetical protein